MSKDKLVLLVTGGEGFIGSHLVESFLAEGHEVRVIDDQSAPENLTFYTFSGAAYWRVSVQEHCGDAFEGVDVVLHHAARSRIQPSFFSARETYTNNVLGTQAVLQAAVDHGVKRVIYAGSSSCYGLKNTPPLREDMSNDCLNHYALSKRQGEELCAMYSRLYGLETVVLRYFNVYGPREPLKGVYAPVLGIFKQQKAKGNPLTIVGDGYQRRDFTHVLDVVHANRLVMKASTTELFPTGDVLHDVFNVGTGKSYSVNEVAEMVGGSKVHVPARLGEARQTQADFTKLKERLGWQPTRDLSKVLWEW